MAPPVPAVEIPDHGDAPGIGRPDRETHAGDALDRQCLSAEAAAKFVVRALGEQIQVELAQQHPEAVGVFGLLRGSVPVDPQAIAGPRRQHPGEEPGPVDRREWGEASAVFGPDGVDAGGARHQHEQRIAVKTEDGERVAETSGGEFGQSAGIGGQADHRGDAVPPAASTSASSIRPRIGTGIQPGRLAAS